MTPTKKDDPKPVGDDSRKALAALREKIDAVDDTLVQLLNQRARLAQDVGAVKARHQQRMYVPERERQLLERLCERSEGPLPNASLRLIYKEIISASLALESPLEVAYLGPEATFTHAATKRHFGMSARLRPCKSIAEVFEDVAHRRCAYGVVPIENTNEGVVIHTLDMFITSDLTICAEVLLPVSHHLLTRGGDIQGVTKVYAPASALTSCRSWLGRNLPSAALVDVPSTVRAAQLALEDASAAAVGTDLAASMYGLRVAASSLDDTSGNLTRFLIVGEDRPEPTGNDRTSIVFALKDSPGILFRALEPFAAAGINMSRIESRPSRKRAWDYLFFIDLDGHRAEASVAEGIRILEGLSVFCKVLGSYPRAALSS